MSLGKLPAPLLGYQVNPLAISTFASDHRPVLIDFILPAAAVDPCPSVANLVVDDFLDFLDISLFLSEFFSQGALSDLNGDGKYDFLDISMFLQAFAAGCP